MSGGRKFRKWRTGQRRPPRAEPKVQPAKSGEPQPDVDTDTDAELMDGVFRTLERTWRRTANA